jgi:hypothetical protein
MPKQFANDTDELNLIFDMAESRKMQIIRIKERSPYMTSPEKTTKTTVMGFDAINSRGQVLASSSVFLYPCIDGHRYGYIPNTPYNMKKLKKLVSSKNIVLDDPEFQEWAIQEAEKAGLPTEYVAKRNNLGWNLDHEEKRKIEKIKDLEKRLEQKRLDDRIAELERDLELEDSKKEIKETDVHADKKDAETEEDKERPKRQVTSSVKR